MTRMILTVAILGVGTWAFVCYPTGWTHYAWGWCDVECELWQGKATIYAVDWPLFTNTRGID
jgi:hypothetical protein